MYVNETVGVVLKIKFSSETSREACVLYALNQYEGFPVLHCWLGSGTVQQMTGRPLTAANVPHDGLLQLADILETLDVLGPRPRKGECVFVAGAVRGVRARLWQQDSRVVCGDAGLLCAAPGRVPD